MAKSALARIPAGIWTLGVVSMLMDVSSELIHSLLPLFLVTTLGASALTVGLIEGVAEATALITKVFSGYLSERRDDAIADEIIDEWGAGRPRIPQIAHLDRRRAQGKRRGDCTMGVAFEIDQDIDSVGLNLSGEMARGRCGCIDKAIESPDQPRPSRAAVVGTGRISNDVESNAIVLLK
jgi:hypothetical protein